MIALGLFHTNDRSGPVPMLRTVVALAHGPGADTGGEHPKAPQPCLAGRCFV